MTPAARRAAVLLLAALSAGCVTAGMQHSDGVRAFEQGDYELAVSNLEQAVKRAPSKLQYRLDLRMIRAAAVQHLIAAGDLARARGDGEGATTFYRRVLTIEPRNDRALRGLQAVEADQRHVERTAKATQLFGAKNVDAAELEVRAVLAEDPGFGPASALLTKIGLARAPVAATPRLRTRDGRLVTLQFRDAPTKMVFEALARQTGVNFVFDKDVKSDGKTTIFVNQVSVEQAIDLILTQNQLGRQVLSENVVLVYPDTPAKHKDYRNEIVHTFYLTNATPKDAESMLKTVLGAKTLFVDERSGTVVMRDTPEHVQMAQKLVDSLDLPEPEVIMEVEVLEITHSLAQQLGINYPANVALAPTKPPNSRGATGNVGSTAGLVLSDLAKQTADTIAVSSLGISIDLLKTVGLTNILSSPRIRARNKEKAHILVGSKLPVVTSGTAATSGGSFSTSSVSYIEVGISLDVQPLVRNDGGVAIKVALEVSSIVKQVSVPNGNGGSTLAYEIGTRNASTLLELQDGETQVLAGLIQDSDHRNSDHIPGLGDIPVIGRLFGSTGNSHDKNEIVLSITPRIVRAQPRPSNDITEFFYGNDSQSRTAPFWAGAPAGAGGAPGTGPDVPGTVSIGGGTAGTAPAPSSGARPVPARIEASTARPALPAPVDAASSPASPASVVPGAKATPASKLAEDTEADATAAVPAAAADSGPRVTIEGPDTAKVGDEIRVSVKLSSASALGRIRTQVLFDATALQLVGAEPGDLAPSGEKPKLEMRPGGVQLDLAGGIPISGGAGSLLDLRFRAVAARPAVAVGTQVVLVGQDGVAMGATQATPLKIAVGP